MSGWLATVLGTWALPRDGAGWLALAGALVAALLVTTPARRAVRLTIILRKVGPRGGLALGALGAALLSWGYVHVYLRGGPRIVDATSYLLEARTFAAGAFRFAVPDGVASASLRGRFLVVREGTLGVLFPPGYPAWLSLFVRAGAPLIAGPVTAALLVPATAALGTELGHAAGLGRARRRSAAVLAAVASVLCSTLRYHTADTMSHGLTALATTLVLALALHAHRTGRGRSALFAGVALGVVGASRPVSALAPAAATLVLLLGVTERRGALAVRVLLGALPGLALLAAYQQSLTGSPLLSPQRVYYAVADAPRDCFRYGFGAGVGCLFEHGDFVRARLPAGYGVLEAAGTTLRRLHLHLRDGFELEPLVLVPLALAVSRRRAAASLGVRAAVGLVVAQVLAYVPFYFDGNFPAGGARFFADVLPVEHALFGVAVGVLAPRLGLLRAAFGLASLLLGGFALHRSHDHLALRDREGGRPAFDRDEAARAVRERTGGSARALVLVTGDDAFALGHDPGDRDALVVLRRRDDARDLLAARAFDRPVFGWDPLAAPGARLVPLAPRAARDGAPPRAFDLEAEAEWPALAVHGGLAAPAWVDGCASGQRALALDVVPLAGQRAQALLELPSPLRGPARLAPVIVRRPGDRGHATLMLDDQAAFTWDAEGPPCETLPSQTVELHPGRLRLVLAAEGTGAALDRVRLLPPDDGPPPAHLP